MSNFVLAIKFAMIAVLVGLVASTVSMVQNVSSERLFDTDGSGQVTWQGTTP